MKSPPKLLAVDLDGTLLARNGEPHQADVAALRAARDAGVVVTILTGRLLPGTRAAARALGFEGPMGCADGAHILHSVTEETLLHRTLKGAPALSMHAHLSRTAGVSTFLFIRDRVVHDEAGLRHLEYLRGWSPSLDQVRSIYAHGSWHDDSGLTAVVSVGDEVGIRDAAQMIRSQLQGHAQVLSFALQSGAWGLIARAHGVSKGTGLEFIAKQSGVAMADTVAVGDWLNDLPMFSVAGQSFAMGQAPAEVREAVTAVLPETSVTGGGIARVVRDVFGVEISS